MSDESIHEKQLGGKLLASVSRSFYLTLKALPKQVREPISLAYLLARSADTIADTAAVHPATRLDILPRFRDLIMGDANEEEEKRVAVLLQGRFCPHQTDEAEARLMEHFRDSMAWLRTTKGALLAAIRDVMRPIIEGQILDIERFPGDGKLRALQTTEQLDEYTWLVAGCVGEFWTKLCIAELPKGFRPGADHAALIEDGIRYGKGLQLINILRDLPEDIADGRCYLPEDELKRAGRHLAEIKLSPKALDTLRADWLVKCEAHLERGLHYVTQIADGKLCFATSLPLLLGVRTAALLRGAKWDALAAGVKVSRFDVAKILAETALACRKEGGIEKLYRKLRAA